MDVAYDKTNESMYKYMENVCEDIGNISAPLSEYLGIKMFGYGRVFFDGRYIAVNEQLNFSKALFQFILTENVAHLRAKDFIPLQLSSVQGIIPWVESETPKSKMGQFRNYHGFRIGIYFERMLSDSMEYWIFSGDKESPNIRDFCVRNYDTFLKFIHFFNTSRAEIIKYGLGDEHKVGFFNGGCKFIKELQSIVPAHETLAINAFLEELQKKSKYLHKIKPGLTYLTPREQDCLGHLAKGDTAKEIAQSLEISPRTVETHLKTIKYKTGFHSRSQLVKFFLNHFS